MLGISRKGPFAPQALRPSYPIAERIRRLETRVAKHVRLRRGLYPVGTLLTAVGALTYFVFGWGAGDERQSQENMLQMLGKLDAIHAALGQAIGRIRQAPSPEDQAIVQSSFYAIDRTEVVVAQTVQELEKGAVPVFDMDIGRGMTGPELLSLAGNLPPIELGAESTMAADERLGYQFYEDEQEAFAAQQRLAQETRLFPDFYTAAYGIPLLESPIDRQFATINLMGGPVQATPLIFAAPFWGFINNQGKGSFFAYYPVHVGQNRLEPVTLRAPYSYAQYVSGEIDAAVNILASAYPEEIRVNNWRALARFDLISNHLEIMREDPAQDAAAAVWAGCAMAPSLVAEAAKRDVGIEYLGARRSLPAWMWRAASFTRKYQLDRQGLGPNQVIMGLAKRAADNPETLARYAPYLVPEDFADDEAAVCTLLDPKKSAVTRVMIYDYVLGGLLAGPFSDPRVRLPVDYAPYISDPKTAREYSLLYLTLHLTMFPENDTNAMRVLAAPTKPLYNDLFIMGEVFGFSPELPGLLRIRYDLDGQQVYLLTADPSHEDLSMVAYANYNVLHN